MELKKNEIDDAGSAGIFGEMFVEDERQGILGRYHVASVHLPPSTTRPLALPRQPQEGAELAGGWVTTVDMVWTFPG
jgi:hypothetical protein